MGMFDTIVFDRPLSCPECGDDISSMQIKWADCTLSVYRVGDVIVTGTITGVLRDDAFCKTCRTRLPVFLVFHRHVLIGITQDYEYALSLIEDNPDRHLVQGYAALCRERDAYVRWLAETENFLRDIYRKFYEGLGSEDSLIFSRIRSAYVRKAKDPLQAVRHHLFHEGIVLHLAAHSEERARLELDIEGMDSEGYREVFGCEKPRGMRAYEARNSKMEERTGLKRTFILLAASPEVLTLDEASLDLGQCSFPVQNIITIPWKDPEENELLYHIQHFLNEYGIRLRAEFVAE